MSLITQLEQRLALEQHMAKHIWLAITDELFMKLICQMEARSGGENEPELRFTRYFFMSG